MRINVPTIDREPEDTVPFTMVPALVWKAYDSGELNQEMLLTFAVLSHNVNPHEGIGRTNYGKICTWLQLDPSKQNVNRINKLMMSLRDEHELIWFPSHSGSRDFQYLVANYKLARKTKKDEARWVDISQCFQKKIQNDSRGNNEGLLSTLTKIEVRKLAPEQRLETPNNSAIKSLGEIAKSRWSRPPYTETENDT